MIDINDITLQIGSKTLLKNTSLHLSDGWRIGIIGDNGCGKSTFFKALSGELEVTGEINFSSNQSLSFMHQQIDDTTISIQNYVLQQDKKLCLLREREKSASDLELAQIHDELKMLDSQSAEARIAQILTGLGFNQEDLEKPVSDFSGGWRMRLALASALFIPSDILLLDEPTNHLDLEATLWLENRLSKYTGTLLIISHDRKILNSLCNHIIHFDHQKLTLYNGNYDTFFQTRQTQQKVLIRQAQRLEEQRAHLQSFVDRFRYKASKAKQAQSRIKMLQKLQEMPQIFYDKEESFLFPDPKKMQPPLISLENVSTGYGDKTILHHLNLSIGENERIALLGKNGNGKSTFAKLLDNKLPIFEGKIHKAPKLEIGYFAQHQEEELPLDLTPCQYLMTLDKDKSETQIRAHLASFGLFDEKALTQIKLLSGGEKARLLFAVMSLSKPNLLILDEPTNHLDIRARDALIDALNHYQGSVILITHDFHLIENVADELWLINRGKCTPFQGDLDDYQAFLLTQNTPKEKKQQDKQKELHQQEQQKLKQSKQQQRQVRAKLNLIEKKLDELSLKKSQLEERFQTPLSSSEIINIQQELMLLSKEIEKTEEEWLLLSESL